METLRYVVLVNGLLAVVGLAYYVLLRRETFFDANRLALWLGVTGAFILPLLELPDWRPQPVRSVMQRTAQAIVPKVLPNAAPQPDVTITFPNGQTVPAFQQTRTPVTWSWQQWLIGVYVLGILLLLIRFGYQLLSLRKLIRQSGHEPYDDFILVRNESVTSPFSFFRWVVLNPDLHTPDELEQILRHERVHVGHRHSVDMLGAELVCIVFWFNPAAYLFRHLLHQTLEFSADRAVLAEGIDAKLYQYNLLKVSLSDRQSVITNHFSKSQLKSRILMLNRQESPKASWLKYPVFFMAALTIASAFARPQYIKVLSKYVPRPIAETISIVAESPNELVQPQAQQLVDVKSVEPETTKSIEQKLPVQQGSFKVDSFSLHPKPDTVRVSPSRYMVYQGNYLYWIVTPKTTFDDFAVIKQELAKYGCQLQLNEVKYDPLYAYIEHIVLSTVGPNGVQAKINEVNSDNKPIPTNAGYITMKDSKDYEVWSSRLNGRFSKTFPLYQTAGEKSFPDVLRKVAADDESAISQFMDDRKMEYLVLAGERKYGHLGIGFRKFDKEEIIKQSRPNSAISIKTDGSIVINEAPRIIKAYINNEPTALDNIQQLKISQLYTVAVILGYDAATNKRTGTEYLFFYVNEDN